MKPKLKRTSYRPLSLGLKSRRAQQHAELQVDKSRQRKTQFVSGNSSFDVPKVVDILVPENLRHDISSRNPLSALGGLELPKFLASPVGVVHFLVRGASGGVRDIIVADIVNVHLVEEF